MARIALALALLVPLAVRSQVSLSVNIAPPPLPIYAQPVVPGDGYIWAPGYWMWNPAQGDYDWVPGTWVLAPNPGDLWTPGYWAYDGGGYLWHAGYWGLQVGFYGGLNYGYGYNGQGYQGGRWNHGMFQYNRAASNVGSQDARNVYNARVMGHAGAARVSFNGGRAGTTARPTGAQRQLQSAPHAGLNAQQLQHEHAAMNSPAQRAAGSGGAALVAATPRPSEFTAPNVEHARPVAAARPAPGPAPARQGGAEPRAAAAGAQAPPHPPQQARVQPAPAPQVRAEPAAQVRPPQQARVQPVPQREAAPQVRAEPMAQARPPPQARVQAAPQRPPQEQSRAEAPREEGPRKEH
jgi:hypothetical protein